MCASSRSGIQLQSSTGPIASSENGGRIDSPAPLLQDPVRQRLDLPSVQSRRRVIHPGRLHSSAQHASCRSGWVRRRPKNLIPRHLRAAAAVWPASARPKPKYRHRTVEAALDHLARTCVSARFPPGGDVGCFRSWRGSFVQTRTQVTVNDVAHARGY